MNQICAVGVLCKDAVVLELIKGIPTALAALLIGGIAAVIAYRQYKVAAGKLKLDLFEHRYAIYDLVWSYITECATEPPEKRDNYMNFCNSIPRAYFIFGHDVGDYMRSIRANAEKMDEATGTISKLPKLAPQRVEAEKIVERLVEYFSEETSKLGNLFGPYMDFNEWRGKPRTGA